MFISTIKTDFFVVSFTPPKDRFGFDEIDKILLRHVKYFFCSYLDTIIKIFSSILYEQKLIFIGNDLGPLTRLINTFICLLYPFSWPHTYIPVLPALMLDIIQAPTPYIIGILRSCEYYLS